jgi:glucosyl-dolichyl phosphate glucuronosyltransferase
VYVQSEPVFGESTEEHRRFGATDTREWEVLVVDNNSSDQTREVVGSFSRRYPGRFRYLFESHPGKLSGLNAGIGEARGDVLLLWTTT